MGVRLIQAGNISRNVRLIQSKYRFEKWNFCGDILTRHIALQAIM
jgi:hypothetical protein